VPFDSARDATRNRYAQLAFRPFTRNVSPISTFTPLGAVIGLFPTLDMAFSKTATAHSCRREPRRLRDRHRISPSHALLWAPGRTSSPWAGQDVHASPPTPWNLFRGSHRPGSPAATPASMRGDHRLVVGLVLQIYLDRLPPRRLRLPCIQNVAFVLQNRAISVFSRKPARPLRGARALIALRMPVACRHGVRDHRSPYQLA